MPQPSTHDSTRDVVPLVPPARLISDMAVTDHANSVVASARQSVRGILDGIDDRLLVVIGPCSIHDPAAALDYAGRLAGQRAAWRDELEIVMRVYFEKPRTTVG